MENVSQDAEIGENFIIGPGSIIKAGARIGMGVTIGANSIVNENVEIGDGTHIGNNVVLGEYLSQYYDSPSSYQNPPLKIGAGAIIRTGSVIYAGSEFGPNFVTGNYVIIRENSKFGANCMFGTMCQTEGDVINVAMMLETQAFDLYSRYSQRIEDEKGKAVLREIADEEKAHLSSLGRLMEARA